MKDGIVTVAFGLFILMATTMAAYLLIDHNLPAVFMQFAARGRA